MFLRFLVPFFWVITLVFSTPSAFAGKVELTTYYPSPMGEYKNLNSTEDSNFATTSGNVGIGTTDPKNKFDVNGDIKVGASNSASITCASDQEGSLRYNSASKLIEYCNGTNYVTVGGGPKPTARRSVHKRAAIMSLGRISVLPLILLLPHQTRSY